MAAQAGSFAISFGQRRQARQRVATHSRLSLSRSVGERARIANSALTPFRQAFRCESRTGVRSSNTVSNASPRTLTDLVMQPWVIDSRFASELDYGGVKSRRTHWPQSLQPSRRDAMASGVRCSTTSPGIVCFRTTRSAVSAFSMCRIARRITRRQRFTALRVRGLVTMIACQAICRARATTPGGAGVTRTTIIPARLSPSRPTGHDDLFQRGWQCVAPEAGAQ